MRISLFLTAYIAVVELLIYAASASENRSRRSVLTLTYTGSSSER